MRQAHKQTQRGRENPNEQMRNIKQNPTVFNENRFSTLARQVILSNPRWQITITAWSWNETMHRFKQRVTETYIYERCRLHDAKLVQLFLLANPESNDFQKQKKTFIIEPNQTATPSAVRSISPDRLSKHALRRMTHSDSTWGHHDQVQSAI